MKNPNNKSEEVPLLHDLPERGALVNRKQNRNRILVTLGGLAFIALVLTLALVLPPNNNGENENSDNNSTTIASIIDDEISSTTRETTNFEEQDAETNPEEQQVLQFRSQLYASPPEELISSDLKNSQKSEKVEKNEEGDTNIVTAEEKREEERLSPVIEIRQGKLQGNISKTRNGRDYYNFMSIPYALPPVGDRRFEPPQPAEKWGEEIRDSRKARTRCVPIMKPDKGFEGSEDCLHLHIMTPKLPSAGHRHPKLPVMFYILGGGFTSGIASRYNGKYLMDEDIVIVFVDFRLGVFGLLNTGDNVISGNMMFKDQVMALKWVQENIEKFGGDKKKVTIFGNSSGSISVHGHLLSKMSKGLFHRAISESGVVMHPNVPSVSFTDPGSIARKVAVELGCSQNSTKEMAKCLKNMEAKSLAAVNRPDITWCMTGEAIPGDGDLSQVFLSETPMSVMRKGEFNRVPWIAGINSGEKFGDSYELLQDAELLNQNFTSIVTDAILHIDDPDQEISKKLRESYFNGSYIDASFKDDLTDLLSDRVWIHPTRIAGMMHSKYSPVYFYYFNYEPTVSHHEKKKFNFSPPHGAGHGDEIQYLFNFERFPEITKGSKDYEFSKDFIKIWASFATNGIPNGTIAHGNEVGAPWEIIQKEDNGMVWFQLNGEARMPVQPFTKRMQFWDSFPIEFLYGN